MENIQKQSIRDSEQFTNDPISSQSSQYDEKLSGATFLTALFLPPIGLYQLYVKKKPCPEGTRKILGIYCVFAIAIGLFGVFGIMSSVGLDADNNTDVPDVPDIPSAHNRPQDYRCSTWDINQWERFADPYIDIVDNALIESGIWIQSWTPYDVVAYEDFPAWSYQCITQYGGFLIVGQFSFGCDTKNGSLTLINVLMVVDGEPIDLYTDDFALQKVANNKYY